MKKKILSVLALVMCITLCASVCFAASDDGAQTDAKDCSIFVKSADYLADEGVVKITVANKALHDVKALLMFEIDGNNAKFEGEKSTSSVEEYGSFSKCANRSLRIFRCIFTPMT